ncbi:rhomboid family intramembrane serine protease GlpG [Alteromonas halophila]|uniref:Rhomboid family intramembrane serine protease GlpG n=1 Tax=Alteromonas halophila TaxID=516698 RepID=A0A918MXR1_9ALTE|nr:rhomboid family intramembrane serine protease GlpG [Alteromonas halophila]GGW85112.1 rhomboid family intramembrane serine protease GlpG [Alteromonas halophila]
MSTPLVTFRQQGPAQLLANYLRTQGIDASVSPQPDARFLVELADGSQSEEARDIAEQFVRDPANPKYQQAAWQQGEKVTLARQGPRMSQNILANARHAPFTAVVFAVCVLTYLLSMFGLFSPIAQNVMMQPLPVLLENNQWWRVLGPAFIHFSILHIVFNLLWWGMLGAQIERTLGLSMLLLVFGVSAILSNIAQSFFTDPISGMLLPFGGLSGVVYALMGFVWWLGWLRPQWGLSLSNSIVGFMLVWLVLGYADVLWVNMANAAHTVGLITGCGMAALLALGAGKR